MAFKNSPPPAAAPDSPEKLILDLPRRKIKGALLHQGEMMKSYAEKALQARDVALQLPTGSGKTLVGLMIAEWRRRKFQEKVVYLCPTRQLVNQVVEQAEDQYGLTVRGFTGSVSSYDPSAKAEYVGGERVAVTTYNALFNTNPFFADPHIIIVDDAHAAENYIASMWSVLISRTDAPVAHTALAGLLKSFIPASSFTRLTGQWENAADATWSDKVPTPTFAKIADEIRTLLDSHAHGTSFQHSWSLIRDHLHGCQLYLTSRDILLRPLIPPTWTHAPFANAKQRIFMSATLGAGGDLERLTGCQQVLRLPVPSGWDRQGIGRRFFIFPGMSLSEEQAADLRRQLMAQAQRSVVLVPSDTAANTISNDISQKLGFPTFKATDIENSKRKFVATQPAVAVVANRYDGIDFPGNDCRLLFVQSLPRATNAQERFLMTRMGANALFNERVQTRVLQAVGRCTRSLEDFSAVVLEGEDITNYLADRQRRRHFHPELQAELEFGLEQSKETTIENVSDNLRIFLENGTEWEGANDQILAKRAVAVQEPLPFMNELQEVVAAEIDYQKRLWQSDFDAGLAAAERVLTGIRAPELRGYRALWHYLAGSAAWQGATANHGLLQKAKLHFQEAKKAAMGIPWLVELSQFQPDDQDTPEVNPTVFYQLERVEAIIQRLGILHDRNFDEREKRILEGLATKDSFEVAHLELGEMLGWIVGKKERDASPDPWWIAGRVCLVFEDHAGAQATSTLDATKARQAVTHPNWVRDNVSEAAGTEIFPVLVTPVTVAEEGAIPHLKQVLCWPLDEFRQWAASALACLRELRRSFSEPGDLFWRARAAEEFERHHMDAPSLLKKLRTQPATNYLKARS